MTVFAPITLGVAHRVVEAGPFTFTETEHCSVASLPPHAHERAAISCVVGGARTYRFASAALDCPSGSAAFIPAGAEHATRFAEGRARGVMIELRGHAFPQPHQRAGFAGLFALIGAELHDPDALTPLALEALAMELLDRAPAWLAVVRDVLRQSFRTRPTLDTLAAIASVDRSTLTRTFRRYARMSIGQYARRARVRRARQLVMTTDLPLSEVAFECGFADQSHLTRAFRQAFGATPRSFKTAACRVPKL